MRLTIVPVPVPENGVATVPTPVAQNGDDVVPPVRARGIVRWRIDSGVIENLAVWSGVGRAPVPDSGIPV